jgi:transitional endoplasmic reticulum ATPase
MNTIKLKVSTAYREDVGQMVARIPYFVMKKLGLHSGDIIKIKGNKIAAARVEPLSYNDPDKGQLIIRMDGVLRQNAGVGLDDYVEVEKVEPIVAQRVYLRPLFEVKNLNQVKEALIRLTKEAFVDSPFAIGNMLVMAHYYYGELAFEVVDVSPKSGDIYIIAPETRIEITKSKGVSKKDRVTYEDIGGLKDAIRAIREMVELPMKHPEIFKKLGIEPPKGVLLYGPPGTGKTLLAKAVANECDAHFISINGPEIMSKFYGESEENLRKVFEEAKRNAPSIIFIDEIDAIAPKRDEARGEVERRIVAQLLTLMDGLESRGQVVVIAATNRPNDIDPALRRPGRFDREIEIGPPDKKGRKEILEIHTRGMPIEPEFDKKTVLKILDELKNQEMFKDKKDKIEDLIEKIKKLKKSEKIKETLENEDIEIYKEVRNKLIDKMLEELAELTMGYSGADLAALCKEAAMNVLKRMIPEIKDIDEFMSKPENLEKLYVTKQDFLEAMKRIQPTVLREVFIEVPKVKWEDIGGLDDVKKELQECIEWPLKYPQLFEKVGITPPKGILLFGPPGTGKTLLAKAVANESNANFIAIKGPEILSKWVGESEKRLREVFRKARLATPCIIFIDEIDSIVPARGSMSSDSGVTERIVATLLNEMDGISELKDVIVIGATNRPDMVDPAILRPGRLEKLIYVRPPNEKERLEIFKVHTRNMSLDKDVDLEKLAKMTEGYTGADIESICRKAGMKAIEEYIPNIKSIEDLENIDVKVKMKHFEEAIKSTKPTIKKEDLEYWEKLSKEFSR